MSTLSRRYWRALTGASPVDEQSPPERGRAGYSLWQRYWSALLGIRLPVQQRAVPDSGPGPAAGPSPSVSVSDHLTRLPRFDLVLTWQASTRSPEPHAAHWTVGGRRFTIRDSGPGEIEVVVREDRAAPVDEVVPVIAATENESRLYFMVRVADETGGSVGVLRLPVTFPWVDVTVGPEVAVGSLDGTSRSVQTQIAASVAATPDPAMPAWAAIAASRPAGDPLSQVIRDAAG